MADIKIDVGNAQLAASGSQDLTISGFGTAKAILGFVVNATADDTLSNDAAIAAFWADDSGAAGSCGIASENGVTTTATYRDAEMPNGDLRLNVAGAGTISLNASARIDSDDATAGPITNGWRIGIDIGTTAVRIVFILFGGADLSAAAWSGNAGDTISVGFESDLILGFGVGNHSGGPYSNAIMSLGASAGSTHRALLFDSRSGLTSDGSRVRVESDCSAAQFYSGGVTWQAVFDTVTGTGFDITATGGSPGSDIIGGVALNLGGAGVHLGTVTAPATAASDWTVSGLGFQPQAALLFMSNATSSDTNTDDWGAGVAALGASAGGSIGVQADGGQATTDTSSVWADEWIVQYDGTGTKTHELAPSSSPFNSDGWTVDAADISTASTAHLWIALAFEAASASGTSGTGASTLAAVTSTGAGSSAIAGAGASTLAAVTSTGAGTVVPTANTGTGASTLAAVTSTGAGSSAIAGAGASTLAAVTSTGAGAIATGYNVGSGASTLADATAAGTGSSSVTAAGTSTLTDATAAGAGSSSIAGAGSSTLQTITGTGSGTNVTLEAILGSGASTLAAALSDGDGSLVTPLAGALYPLDFAAHASSLLALNPPGSSVITHRRAGVIIGYFRGWASQSSMENGALIGGTLHASPADSAVLAVEAGDTVSWDGLLTAEAYVVEQAVTDGVALRRFVLRPHAR